MSVMTTGEQRRRAGATRGRPMVAAAPGQQTRTAGEQRPGQATAPRRHGAAGQAIPHLTLVPPLAASRAPRPEATEAAPAGAAGTAPARATGAVRAGTPGAPRVEAAPPRRGPAPPAPPRAPGAPVRRRPRVLG